MRRCYLSEDSKMVRELATQILGQEQNGQSGRGEGKRGSGRKSMRPTGEQSMEELLGFCFHHKCDVEPLQGFERRSNRLRLILKGSLWPL